MIRRAAFSILTFIAGLIAAGLFVSFLPLPKITLPITSGLPAPKNQIIGFLPYWLTDFENQNFPQYITTLAYFSLRADDNGNILKLISPVEEEPGWHALKSGKLDPFFQTAKANNITLSLLISSGDNLTIDNLVSHPIQNAKNLTRDTLPIMQLYGFQDLNIDIEHTMTATSGARTNFTSFLKTIKQDLSKNHYTLTVEVSPTDLIKEDLIDVKSLAALADKIVIMAYDYHSTVSFVTGPVAPLYGAGTVSEYDVQTAVEKALTILPAHKIILGLPLYGYEWETIGSSPRSAIIPNTGLVASSRRANQLLNSCATCSAQFDTIDQETYIIYQDSITNTYHQIFFPDNRSIESKIAYSQKLNLSGIALWALGYEDPGLLTPLKKYKSP